MTQSTSRATLFLLLATIVATLGFVFAVTHMAHSVWYDESLTDIIVRQPSFTGLVKSAMNLKPYPPGFFVVVRWAYGFDDGPAGMRLPSALFGFLATLGVFFLGRAAGGAAVGALASAFFVLTPGTLRYFSDGNAYTLLMLAAVLSTWLLYRALETDGVGHWVFYGASATLGLATHTIFIFHLGGQILAALWYRFTSKPRGTERPVHSSRRMLATMSVLLVLWLAWVVFYITAGGWTKPFSLSDVLSPSMLLAVPGLYVGPLSFGSLVPLFLWVLLQVAGALAMLRKHRTLFVFLAVSSAASTLAISLFIKSTLSYFAYRYGLGLFPIACVVGACAIRLRPERSRISPGMVRALVLGVATVYLVAGVMFVVKAAPDVWDFQAWDDASALLTREVGAEDAVVVQPPMCIIALQYYYKGPAAMYPQEHVDGWIPSIEELTRSIAAKHPTVWLVVSSFENPSSFVSSFTESAARRKRPRAADFASKIEATGCRVRETRRFLRATVIGFECPR